MSKTLTICIHFTQTVNKNIFHSSYTQFASFTQRYNKRHYYKQNKHSQAFTVTKIYTEISWPVLGRQICSDRLVSPGHLVRAPWILTKPAYHSQWQSTLSSQSRQTLINLWIKAVLSYQIFCWHWRWTRTCV